jgi:hypothetical protein
VWYHFSFAPAFQENGRVKSPATRQRIHAGHPPKTAEDHARAALREIHEIIQRDRKADMSGRNFAAAGTATVFFCFFGWALYISTPDKQHGRIDTGLAATLIFLAAVPGAFAYYFGSSPRRSL